MIEKIPYLFLLICLLLGTRIYFGTWKIVIPIFLLGCFLGLLIYMPIGNKHANIHIVKNPETNEYLHILKNANEYYVTYYVESNDGTIESEQILTKQYKEVFDADKSAYIEAKIESTILKSEVKKVVIHYPKTTMENKIQDES